MLYKWPLFSIFLCCHFLPGSLFIQKILSRFLSSCFLTIPRHPGPPAEVEHLDPHFFAIQGHPSPQEVFAWMSRDIYHILLMAEILRSPVEVGSLSHYLPGFSTIQTVFVWKPIELNTTKPKQKRHEAPRHVRGKPPCFLSCSRVRR